VIHLTQKHSDLFVPDGLGLPEALSRTTHLAIGAHQDDLEFFAAHGILQCFARADRWFCGVTVTDGRGSARAGGYRDCDDATMAATRRNEQRKAAVVGEYGAVVQLAVPSATVKDPAEEQTIAELAALLDVARPEVLYLHNPTDRHDTHIAVLTKCLAALRRLPPEHRPATVYGCEVWRDLDWVPADRIVALPVGRKTNLQAALNGVFDSQISGGKRYDLAVMGRRLAHATFHESHAVDAEAGLTLALDLTPLCQDDGLSLDDYCAELLTAFSRDIQDRIARFQRSEAETHQPSKQE